MTVFLAMYPSECFVCENGIHVEDPVTWRDGEVIHEQCATKTPKADRPVEVCQKCFMALPATGICECEE